MCGVGRQAESSGVLLPCVVSPNKTLSSRMVATDTAHVRGAEAGGVETTTFEECAVWVLQPIFGLTATTFTAARTARMNTNTAGSSCVANHLLSKFQPCTEHSGASSWSLNDAADDAVNMLRSPMGHLKPNDVKMDTICLHKEQENRRGRGMMCQWTIAVASCPEGTDTRNARIA